MGRYINPSTHYKKLFFEEKLKHFNMSGERHPIFTLQRDIIVTFCQSGILPDNINKEISPNIWNRTNFKTTTLYALGVQRQFQGLKLSNWICFTVKLKLKSLKLYVKFELFRSSYFHLRSRFR